MSPAALIGLAAWNNVTPETCPPEWREQPQGTVDAWERVVEAVREHVMETVQRDYELVFKGG